MLTLKEKLLIEENKLKDILKRTSEEMDTLPEGNLRISTDATYPRYYISEKGHSDEEKYLPHSEIDLVKGLAQRNYDKKLINLTKKRLKQIDNILKDYSDDEIERVYTSLCDERKKLVLPVTPLVDNQIRTWLETPYTPKPFEPGTKEIYTEKGLRVRSKSEEKIAEYLDRNNIPYKYECPLYLEGYGIVYPDFTFLSRITLKEVYWEHEGMMDDPDYATKAVKKINGYDRSGIYVGDRLILTFETKQTVLNTQTISHIVKQYRLY